MRRSLLLATLAIASLTFATVAAAHTVKYDVAVKAKVKKGGKDAGGLELRRKRLTVRQPLR